MRPFLIVLPLLLCSCITSRDVKKKYEDPTGVVTVDNPDEKDSSSSAQTLRLQKENAILMGKVEELLAELKQERRAGELRISNLAAENIRLRQELEKFYTKKRSRKTQKSTARLLWRLAKKDIDAKRYSAAVTPLKEINRRYPKDARNFYAQLALGMIDYAEGRYKQAAVSFNILMDQYPKHSKIQLAWFGQGASFWKMGQKSDGKLFFSEVSRRYPRTNSAIVSRSILKEGKKVPTNLFLAFPNWEKGAPN